MADSDSDNDSDQDKLNEAEWQVMLPLKSPKPRKGFDGGWLHSCSAAAQRSRSVAGP